MGRKRGWPGQYVYVYIALVMCLGLSNANCTALKSPRSQQQAGVYQHLHEAHRYLVVGNYEASFQEYQTVLSLSVGKPPADEALFNMGLIQAESGNPKKDYAKSVDFFKQISGNYPQSAYAHQANTWAEILQENIRLKQMMTEALRENERLKRVLEESKKIDVEIGEKMRRKER